VMVGDGPIPAVGQGLIPGTEGGATGLVPIPGNDARVWYRYNMYMHSYVS
jgi:hypothetical protein